MKDLDSNRANNYIDPLPIVNFDFSTILTKTMQEAVKSMNENLMTTLRDSVNLMNRRMIHQLSSIMFQNSFNFSFTQNKKNSPQAWELSRKRTGIIMTKIGTFKYKRRFLKGLSQKNTEGRILAAFMNRNLFASDESIKEITRTRDYRDFGWAIRNLKYKFKANNLQLDLERIGNPDGYTIRNISYLQ